MIKQGYSLLEMLLVLCITMILLLFSVQPFQREIHPSDNEILYQLSVLLESARFEAVTQKTPVSVDFLNDCICLPDDCYFKGSGLIIKKPAAVTFNEHGHIQKAKTIHFCIRRQCYQLIFNVGEGAYHLEKEGFCFAGCFICLADLYKLHRSSFFSHFAVFKQAFTNRRRGHGKNPNMAGKRGFTLIEALLALFVSTLIISMSTLLLSHILQSFPAFGQDDIAYAVVSLTEDVNLASEVICEGQTMKLVYPNQEKTYELHQGRLVKTPGFDIYLHHVDNLYFETDGIYMYMTIERGEKSEMYQIGVYQRPQTNGLCQPDSFNDTDDFYSIGSQNREDSLG